MAMLARLQFHPDQLDQRSSHRCTLELHASGASGSEGDIAVLIHDLSFTGLHIETSAEIAVGDTLEVELPEAGSSPARVVWNRGSHFGCEFLTPIPKSAISAALLKNPIQRGGSQFSETADKLPLRTRLFIMLGLALASWVVVLSLVWLISLIV